MSTIAIAVATVRDIIAVIAIAITKESAIM